MEDMDSFQVQEKTAKVMMEIKALLRLQLSIVISFHQLLYLKKILQSVQGNTTQ
jgi:hypothetical protein